jgi:type IV secretory pathway VirB4 component
MSIKNIFGFLKETGTQEEFKVPKSAQQSIPIKTLYKDGIMRVGNRFSKTLKFTDINYSVASDEDKEDFFRRYSSVLNSLTTEAITKITINNRKLNLKDFKSNMLLRHEQDSADVYRDEINGILLDKMADSNNIVQEKYITISTIQKNIQEARAFFARVCTDLKISMGQLSSQLQELSTKERLRIFHDFYRGEEEQDFDIDLKKLMRLGHDFKDMICPDIIEFKSDHFIMGEKYGRVLFLKDFPSFMKDEMVRCMTDFSRNLMMSIDIMPIPTAEAIREVQKKILAVETDITKWQNKQNMNNNFSASIPYELEQMREEIKEYLDDLTTRDQRMMSALITLVHTADSLEQLNADTKTLVSIGLQNFCQFATLKFQQEDALKTVLPYGLLKIDALRTLTTESTAVIMPFKTQEILDKGGIYYGVNAISHNLLLCNRKLLLNGNGFILGVSGSGKSFATKMEIALATLYTDDDIIIADPEREYAPLVSNLHGEIIQLSASSDNHINALEMERECGYGENPIGLKSEFLMSLFDQLLRDDKVSRIGGGIGPKDKSIIDRCTLSVYKAYLRDASAKPPTLIDFRNELFHQPEPEAKDLALALELFTEGSLNVFAHQSNVDINKRIVCYDILELGTQLKPIGLLIMLDNILNRVIENRKRGKYTRVYIDETHLFFANLFSAQFLSNAWLRFRKYGGLVTGVTQNVEKCLSSETARTMLANSEFLVMLNQAATDRIELAKILNISNEQMKYIDNTPAGQGLIKVGASIVPFINDFPTDTQLYKLMTTKPGEG